MGDGVSPEDGAMNLCDDENKKDEVFHDADENGYTSDAAGGRAAEKSMASANAEAPGAKAAEAEAGWTRVGGKQSEPVPVNAPTETTHLSGYWQILCESGDDVTKALQGIGATQTKPLEEKKWRWLPILFKDDGYRSYRSEKVTMEATKSVLACVAAADRHSWIMAEVKENDKHTRIRFVVPGRSPSHWQAPTRTGVPASPAPTVPRPPFPTEKVRKEWHRQAWEASYPQMQKKPPQEESRAVVERIEQVEKLLQELLAQRQPPATAAATPVVPVPTVELLKRIQDLEDDKAKMAEQLKEVRELVDKQDKVAATQQARYERSNRILLEGRFEDKETMKAQQKEILELKRRLQQQEEETVVDVATESVHETPSPAETSEATQQDKKTQWNPDMWHTPSPEEKKEQRKKEVEEALRSLGRSPREEGKNLRKKKSRQRQRNFAERVERAGEETAVAPVARRFHSEDSGEDDRWLPVPAGEPVEYLGGGLEGLVGGKRLSDREPGLSGTPEFKGGRLVSAVYADSWQYPQRVENPYRPDPSDSDWDLEENPDDWGAN